MAAGGSDPWAEALLRLAKGGNMQTRLCQAVARLALALTCISGAAWPLGAQEPRVFPSAQFPPPGMMPPSSPYAGMGPQASPYAQGGQAYAQGGPQAYAPDGSAAGPCGDPRADGAAPCQGTASAQGDEGGCCGGMGRCPCGECLGRMLAGLYDLRRGVEWRYAAGGVFMQRESAGSQTLFRDNFTLQSNEVFNAKDLQFDIPGGFALSIARISTYGWDVEGNYTHIDSFEASRVLSGNVFLQTDTNGGNFTVLNPQLKDDSLLNSAELNVRWRIGERFRLLTGFRWVELEDRYRVDSVGAQTGRLVTLRNSALNELYGFQLGGDATVFDWGFVTVDFGAKLGVYTNNSSQNSREVDTGFVDRSLAAQGGHTAFSAEMHLGGTLEVIMDRLYLRGGYQMLWLDGVLSAPDQIGANNFTSGTAGLRYDTVFYHGAYASLELAF
jgi:hypothetical protein